MTDKSSIEAFWRSYLDELPEAADQDSPDDVFAFGIDSTMADELGTLVATGEKTASSSAYWSCEHGDEKLPEVGDISIVLDGRNVPLCVIETVEVDVVPFEEVDEAFAKAEGEGFESVEDWREAHWQYFAQSLDDIGRVPTLEMPVVCERFRVVYPTPSR